MLLSAAPRRDSSAGYLVRRSKHLLMAQKIITKPRSPRQPKQTLPPHMLKVLAQACQKLLFQSTGLSVFTGQFPALRSTAETRSMTQNRLTDLETPTSTRHLHMRRWAYSQMLSANVVAQGHRLGTAEVGHVSLITSSRYVQQWSTWPLPPPRELRKASPKELPLSLPVFKTPTAETVPNVPSGDAKKKQVLRSWKSDYVFQQTRALKTDLGKKRAMTAPPRESKKVKFSPDDMDSPSTLGSAAKKTALTKAPSRSTSESLTPTPPTHPVTDTCTTGTEATAAVNVSQQKE